MRAILGILAGASVLALGSAALAETTGVTGGGQPYNNRAPSLVLNQAIGTQGIFPTRDSGGGAVNTMGRVMTWAGAYTPVGSANGAITPIISNTALFSIMGVNYGGNGINNFAMPNLSGRVAIGEGSTAAGTYVVGGVYGSDATVLTTAQLPAHDHTLPGGGLTGVTGSGAPVDNMQSSLAMRYQIAVDGIFPSRGAQTFVGQVGLFTGNYDSGGWMEADGRLLSIGQYSSLFSIIGTTYGGDGQSTFALPDMRGRMGVGAGQGPGLAPIALGQYGGQAETVLTEANMPLHSHSLPGGGVTGSDGLSQPIDNYQPFLGLNYLIALEGIFPSIDRNFAGSESEPILGQIVGYAADYVPQGWARAQGQLLSIAQNSALFALLGCTYGGDCQTTFALPDLRGRAIMGAGAGYTVGQVYGSPSVTLTAANLPAHVHTLPDTGAVPEPGVWALMLMGFFGLGSRLRAGRRAGATRRV